MAPRALAELEQTDRCDTMLSEALDYDLDVAPDDPDFQMEFPLSRLDGIMEDIETGRAETFTWEEVKRRGRAARRA